MSIWSAAERATGKRSRRQPQDPDTRPAHGHPPRPPDVSSRRLHGLVQPLQQCLVSSTAEHCLPRQVLVQAVQDLLGRRGGGKA